MYLKREHAMKSSLLLTVAVAALVLLMVDYGSACGCQDDCCCNYRSRQCCGDHDSSSSSSESEESSEDDDVSQEKLKCPKGYERCASHACYRVVKLTQAMSLTDINANSPCTGDDERLALPDKLKEMMCMRALMKKDKNSPILTGYEYNDSDIVDANGDPLHHVLIADDEKSVDDTFQCVVVVGKHQLSRVDCTETASSVICEYAPDTQTNVSN